MKKELLSLYKIKWKHTANTYVACKRWNKEKLIEMVRSQDDRWDDIVGIEEVVLPAFDGDSVRKNDFIEIFSNVEIL